MTTATKALGLHGKLAAIRGELNGLIVKTGEHTQGGPRYKFVEALEVGRQFVEKASERQITMLPNHMSILDIRPSMTGKQHVVTLGVDWTITDAESDEVTHVYSIGQGADNSDKAAPKAQTNAMKYAILMLLQAAGDDPEKDEPEKPARRAARRVATARNAAVSDDAPEGADEAETRPRARRAPRRAEPPFEAGKEMASPDLKAKVRAKQHEADLTDDQFRALAGHFTGKESSRLWTTTDAEKVLVKLGQESVVEFYRDEVKGIYEPDSVAGGD